MKLNYDDMQRIALRTADDGDHATSNGREAAGESLRARAQVEALLAIGAAIQDLADAIRGKR